MPDHAEGQSEEEATVKENEVNRRIADVIHPHMTQLLELSVYITDACDLIFQFISNRISKKTDPPLSDSLICLILSLLDVLMKLENLKERKMAFHQDFQRYKKCLGTKLSPLENEEINLLTQFLSNSDPKKVKNYIFFHLKEQIKRVNGYEDIIVQILDSAVVFLEDEKYILPDELFRYLRVLPYLLAITDGPAEDPKANVFQHKRIRISAIQKLFKKYPVIPLHGDMPIVLVNVLELAPHFSRINMGSSWADMSEKIVVPSDYKLTSHWKDIRDAHSKLSMQLAVQMSQFKQKPFSKSIDATNIQLSEQIYDLVLLGLRSLGQWNIYFQLSLAWKYCHPAAGRPGYTPDPISMKRGTAPSLKSTPNSRKNSNAGEGEGAEYELAIRHNLTKEEISVMVDVLSMIKSFSSALISAEATLSPVLRFHMHHTIQQLVQADIVPLLHRVDKRNRQSDLSELLNLRATAADWLNGTEPTNDYKNYSRKQGAVVIQHPPRAVSTTSTQLYLLRTFVQYVTDDAHPLRQRKGILSSAEMESVDVKLFEKFLLKSYFFPSLLSFNYTIKVLCDLGELWYRETFLELTRCVQFPIEMSLPWILTENILSGKDTAVDVPMIENILYTLDLYNDAAQKSLYEYNLQYLYDEVEAEANLVLDQVIVLLSDDIYSYYKSVSATLSIEKALKHKLEELKGSPHLTVSTRRYELPALQRHTSILGRYVNFNYLIGQHITRKYIQDLDTMLKKFESCSVEQGIIELKNAFFMMKRLHKFLSEAFTMESFDVIFGEVEESIPTTGYRGRISIHVLRSLTGDIFPNYSYNYHTRRFIKSPVSIRLIDYGKVPKSATLYELYGQASMKAYEMTSKITKGYLGKVHIEALLEIGCFFDISALIIECLGFVTVKIKDIVDYVDALNEGVTPVKLPKFLFKSAGCYGYFESKFKSILEYDDLKPEVFESFREVGNTLSFLRDLSDAMELYDQSRFISLSPFIGISSATATTTTTIATSSDSIKEDGTEDSDRTLTPISKIFKSILDAARDPKNTRMFTSSTILSQLSEVSELLISSCNSILEYNNIFQFALTHVRDAMDHFELQSKWGSNKMLKSTITSYPYMSLEVEKAMPFHRLFSTLTFLFCMYDNDVAVMEVAKGQPITDDGEFGHGFALAGCVFIHLLGQQLHFQLMDYSYHILNVDINDKETFVADANATAKSRSKSVVHVDAALQLATEKFIAIALEQKQLHTEFFHMLQAKCPVRVETVSVTSDASSVHGLVLYKPPSDA